MNKCLTVAVVIITAALMLTACKGHNNESETTEATTAASVIDDLMTQVTTTIETTLETITETVAGTVNETAPQIAITETATVTQEPEAQVSATEETTSVPSIPDETLITEVDLSITLPEVNGSMFVDRDPSNRFTTAVAATRHLDTTYLVAVYSIPESGQNYVFEFNNASIFSADNIRRVFLLNNSCKITGVAASEAGEKENLSATENWFCMNVLIKGVIFPAIEEQFR